MWNGAGTGEWVAKYPDKSDYMHGYMASKMMNVHIDPAEILEDFCNPPHDNLADVYRLSLGRAYSNPDEKLRVSDVYACCGQEYPAPRSEGPCAMGVDVGKIKHVVIGVKIDNKRFRIIKTCKCKDFDEIADLSKRYNVRSTVIDIRPYEDEARAYQKAQKYRTFLCETKDVQVTDSTFNDNTGIVKAGKTEMFDRSQRLIMRGNVVLPRRCPETDEFARQCCNCARFEEKDKRRGIVVNHYRPTGDRQDHFRAALNFFQLAASGHRIAKVKSNKKRQLNASLR